MAYGVKYQLIFSDVLNYGKKVEILKKDYTGKILPMIGGANPVQISWQSSDDFYNPIIGSKCTLSLLVTDSVSYDDFYKFDEREYKVVVSYAKSQGEIYSDRVIADGGTVESYECVDNVLNNFETISTYYQNRVFEDGGEVESLSCVADAITDDNFYRWGTYWSGFLVVDRYKEKLTTPPFGITFNAYDGLGTLSHFPAPTMYNNNLQPIEKNNLVRIKEILDNLSLDLQISIASDISSDGIINFEDLYSIFRVFDELKDVYDVYDAKEMLVIILNIFGLRIYQSYNKWHIVESSNIFDYYVKDQLFNEVQSTGIVPTGIRERILKQLNYTKKEFIDFRNYDKDGNSLGTKRLSILYDNNNELKSIKNDLVREYLKPISEVKAIGKPVKKSLSISNAGFEYGSFDYNIYVNLAEISLDEVSYKGRRSMKLTSSSGTTGQTVCFSYTSSTLDKSKYSLDDIKFQVKYYVRLADNGFTNPNSTFQFRISTTADSRGLVNWDAVQKKWVQGYFTNQIVSSESNKFIDYSTQLSTEGLVLNTSNFFSITVYILNTQTSNTSYVTTYFDDFEINLGDNSLSNVSQNYRSKLINSQNNTAIKTRNTRPFIDTTYARTRENYGNIFTTNLFRSPIDIVNRNIANDFRSFVTRYEGTFRNMKIQPLGFHNKIWFYWNEFETDPQTTIIDGLKYDVKNAEFKIKSHLPNDDDDVDIDFIIS